MFNPLRWLRRQKTVAQITQQAPSLPEDWWELEQFQRCNLFVYDDMMPGHPNYGFISGNAAHAATAYTRTPFAMFKRKSTIEPFALTRTWQGVRMAYPGENSLQFARVKGELFSVSPQLIAELDAYKEHFQRQRVSLCIPYWKAADTKFAGELVSHKPRYVVVEAHMYVGHADYWNSQLDGGYNFSPVKIYPLGDPLKRCYYFDKSEYQDR